MVRPTSSSACLRDDTRAEHDAVEAGLDLRRLRHPAELAALLHGWTGVWHEVQLAAAAPGAAAEATAELLPPATQSLRWLERDLADIGGALAGVLPHETSARTGAAGGSRLRRFLAETSTTWGVAYVLRGSRLGGSVLAPLVRAPVGAHERIWHLLPRIERHRSRSRVGVLPAASRRRRPARDGPGRRRRCRPMDVPLGGHGDHVHRRTAAGARRSGIDMTRTAVEPARPAELTAEGLAALGPGNACDREPIHL